ncbi:MAG TPA: tetratricopeptide repeat protein [Verrucomicrobiae bacterium]
MAATLTESEKAQLEQTIDMFEVITQSQPQDYQSLEILKEAYIKLNREKDMINTAKRIASAYVQLGQLSSAILEYESILQKYPDDPDVQKALAEIENRATNLSAAPAMEVVETKAPTGQTQFMQKPGAGPGAAELEDGKAMMRKIFVDGKLVNAGDFDMYWNTPADKDPAQTIEPFIQVIADKGLLPIEQSLKIITERARLAYMPLDKYDVDMELARSFPKGTCRRWCVVPIDRMSKTVIVATTNPFNKQAAAELEKATNYRLLWYIAPPADLVKVLKRVFR